MKRRPIFAMDRALATDKPSDNEHIALGTFKHCYGWCYLSQRHAPRPQCRNLSLVSFLVSWTNTPFRFSLVTQTRPWFVVLDVFKISLDSPSTSTSPLDWSMIACWLPSYAASTRWNVRLIIWLLITSERVIQEHPGIRFGYKLSHSPFFCKDGKKI